MTHKPHFDSKAARPAADPAALQAGTTQTQENGVKVVHHHVPGFARPQ
jgi:hypothetical protein